MLWNRTRFVWVPAFWNVYEKAPGVWGRSEGVAKVRPLLDSPVITVFLSQQLLQCSNKHLSSRSHFLHPAVSDSWFKSCFAEAFGRSKSTCLKNGGQNHVLWNEGAVTIECRLFHLQWSLQWGAWLYTCRMVTFPHCFPFIKHHYILLNYKLLLTASHPISEPWSYLSLNWP